MKNFTIPHNSRGITNAFLIIPKKMAKLLAILNLLQSETPIPAEYYPHMLTGNYAGFMECHIEGDFLLIWFDHDTDQIDLIRLGSHSELFK